MLKKVISLPRFIDRHEQFKMDNPTLKNFQWSFGIDPLLSGDRDSFLAEHSLAVDQLCNWRVNSISNALSHISLIKECGSGNSSFTIMEDDAILVRDFDLRASALVEEFGCSFDFIQWGFNWDAYLHFYTWGSRGPISQINNAHQEKSLDLSEFSWFGKSSQLKRLVSSWGSHCYTVTPTGAQKILENYSRIRNIEVVIPTIGHAYWPDSFDGVLNGMHATLNSYIAFPPLSFVFNDKAVSKVWG